MWEKPQSIGPQEPHGGLAVGISRQIEDSGATKIVNSMRFVLVVRPQSHIRGPAGPI